MDCILRYDTLLIKPAQDIPFEQQARNGIILQFDVPGMHILGPIAAIDPVEELLFIEHVPVSDPLPKGLQPAERSGHLEFLAVNFHNFVILKRKMIGQNPLDDYNALKLLSHVSFVTSGGAGRHYLSEVGASAGWQRSE
jgi:hypothetical protein